MAATRSKLEMKGERIAIGAVDATQLMNRILCAVGCLPDVAAEVSEHLADASLSGVESHGVMRTLQYVEQMQNGYLVPKARARVVTGAHGATSVDGGGGIGIPAMRLAFDEACRQASDAGVAAVAVRHVGHTGRHGAFAEAAAERGFLTLCMGGGNRQTWRQVAPHGGARAMLPTNPWCVGVPGGDRGPVVLDFATSKIAGGWIYAARSAGALLPEGCIIDRCGNPTRDPQDYFDGGAILPSGEHKGYALALVGELIGEALLGPSSTECQWLVIAIQSARFRDGHAMTRAAEEVLAELRACPPAPGFERVEIPGEREREHRSRSDGLIHVPEATWTQIGELARRLGCS